ncbi:MAG: GTP cyclohydrolase II [Bacteroidota bacterium]
MKRGNPIVKSKLETTYGLFHINAYETEIPELPNLALFTPELDTNEIVNVRIHSECATGDIFSSVKCDCGEQLEYSMKYVQENGGVIVYLRQEGRGIGLVNKLKAYNLQDKGLDTREANLELGFHEDLREYSQAIAILEGLGISKIRLLTNNPLKIDAFEGSGIEVVGRIPIEMKPRETNLFYLQTKKNRMGHLFSAEIIK